MLSRHLFLLSNQELCQLSLVCGIGTGNLPPHGALGVTLGAAREQTTPLCTQHSTHLSHCWTWLVSWRMWQYSHRDLSRYWTWFLSGGYHYSYTHTHVSVTAGYDSCHRVIYNSHTHTSATAGHGSYHGKYGYSHTEISVTTGHGYWHGGCHYSYTHTPQPLLDMARVMGTSTIATHTNSPATAGHGSYHGDIYMYSHTHKHPSHCRTWLVS